MEAERGRGRSAFSSSWSEGGEGAAEEEEVGGGEAMVWVDVVVGFLQ